MNASIRHMLTRPGRYAVGWIAFPLDPEYFGVEVTEDGKCYQLTPDGQRDDELVPDGWSPVAICLGDLLEFEKPRGSA